MVKQKKTDRDKWYYAAKEQGFRSRAAFKLIQINKKFNFLASARACLDLCAAPGGWLQVAAKYMPVSSIIIGVDLFPIKPIRNVITIKEDITTQKCRHEIKKNLQGWKVDVCIHDGAPNLGSAWAHDAYGQSTLTLAAIGLAVDFLREGGTFVTKIFRSADYNSLLWVLNQIFKKVTVTKPPASRNTSAEIFAICEGFLAPKQLDPRFLDPKHVFKELDAPAEKDLYFGQKRAKKHREGYDDGVNMLFKKASIANFIEQKNPTIVLANNHRLEFDEASAKYQKHRATTPEIISCCEDLQVLGKKEIKNLLRWRLLIRRKFFKDEDEEGDEKVEKKKEAEETDEPLTVEEQEKLIDDEIEQKLTREEQKMKQKLKKQRKKRNLLQRRIDMKMDLIGDSIDIGREENLFELSNIKSKAQLEIFTEKELQNEEKSDSETGSDFDSDAEIEDAADRFLYDEDYYNDELEKMLDQQYDNYLQNSQKIQSRLLKSSSLKTQSEYHTLGEQEKNSLKEKIDSANTKTIYDSDSDEEGDNPLIVREASTENPTKRASQWFSQPLFNEVQMDDAEFEADESDSDGEDEEDAPENVFPSKSKPTGVTIPVLPENDDEMGDSTAVSTAEGEDDEGFEVVPAEDAGSDSDMNDYDRAELLAMGTLIKNGKLTLGDLVDEGYNRYAFNDDELPPWFQNEEKKHNQPLLPITKEMVREIMADNKQINARPIKKVAEAKARKKMKAKRKIEKVKSKATSIANDNELTDVAKQRQIEKLYKSQMAKMQTKQIYVVRKKGQKGRQKIGPKRTVGTKVKVVDRRMKSDKRGKGAKRKST